MQSLVLGAVLASSASGVTVLSTQRAWGHQRFPGPSNASAAAPHLNRLRSTANTVNLHEVGEVYTAQWFVDRCTEIKLSCERREEEVERSEASEVRQLEKEYRHESKTLDETNEAAQDADKAVQKQKTVITKVRVQVEQARTVYERTKACPAEHRKLEEELRDLEAEPNDSEEDIDAECMKRKAILEKERCVDEHMEAETALARAQISHSTEREELSEDRASARQQGQAVDPQEGRTDEAKEALDSARERGQSKAMLRIKAQCKADLKALNKIADNQVATASADFSRHESILSSKKGEHKESQEEVKEQKEEVAEEKKQVKEAKVVYEEKKNCPAELEKAEDELARLQSIPNESEEDIDEECQKKKEILEKKRCVDQYIEAKRVLAQSKAEHTEEEDELEGERRDERTDRQAVKKYAKTVAEYEEAVSDAKAARQALLECMGEAKEKSGVVGLHLAMALALGALQLVFALA